MKKQQPIPGERLATAPTCPSCQTLLDGYTAATLDKSTPKPGDVSFCYYCGELLIFKGNPLTIRKPTTEELKEITSDKKITSLHQQLLIDIATRRH